MKKVVIITGASSGIGEGLAFLYAKKGYSLGLIARRQDRLQTIQESLNQEFKINIKIDACDVSDRQSIFKCIESMISYFGQIDLLIANAGISLSSPAYEAF